MFTGRFARRLRLFLTHRSFSSLSSARIVACSGDGEIQKYARQLSDKYRIPMVARGSNDGRFIMDVNWVSFRPQVSTDGAHSRPQTTPGVTLRDLEQPHLSPLLLDFGSPEFQARLRSALGRAPELVHACGVRRSSPPAVLDLTGGWGRDALTLAAYRCPVTIFERHPVVAAILDDALHRARMDRDAAALVSSVQLVHVDALSSLDPDVVPPTARSNPPDVIFVDAMFPDTGRTAAPHREAQYLMALCGAGSVDETVQLVRAALRWAKKRVVVKVPRSFPSWPALRSPNVARGGVDSPLFQWRSPSFSRRGKAIRYDTFAIQSGEKVTEGQGTDG